MSNGVLNWTKPLWHAGGNRYQADHYSAVTGAVRWDLLDVNFGSQGLPNVGC